MPVITRNVGGLSMSIGFDADIPVALLSVSRDPKHGGRSDISQRSGRQQLVELTIDATLPQGAFRSYSDSVFGAELRFVSEEVVERQGFSEWHITQQDSQHRLDIVNIFRPSPGYAAFQAWSEIRNASGMPIALRSASSIALSISDLLWLETRPAVELLLLHQGTSAWLSENRWRVDDLRHAGLSNVSPGAHGTRSRNTVDAISSSTFSTGGALPVGIAESSLGPSIVWQVEHNGPWHWQLSELHDGGVGLVILGPTDRDHAWSELLEPGEIFVTVRASIALGEDRDHAMAELTCHRRRIRGPHPDFAAPAIIYNDYLNTIMADPTSEKLEPLIEAAAAAGVEVFCIDSGWFAPLGDFGWTTMGDWKPSLERFDGGFSTILERIRSGGMKPGLWLEPEMVGHESPLASSLPDSAFLTRDGRRIFDGRRYHLDLSDAAVQQHLDSVIEYLVKELQIGYFKFDHNSEPGRGTDHPFSLGAGLLAHCRGLQTWLRGLRSRYPDVIFENCASGAMRADYALMSLFQLQSTSDQQDVLKIPAIAAGAPMSLAPEQAASWMCPDSSMDRDGLDFAMAAGMLSRGFLSGWINRFSPLQFERVRENVELSKRLRTHVASGVPWWPIDLPGWDDDWIASGIRTDSSRYLTVWRRGGAHELTLPVGPNVTGVTLIMNSGDTSWRCRLEGTNAVVETTSAGPSATVLEIEQ